MSTERPLSDVVHAVYNIVPEEQSAFRSKLVDFQTTVLYSAPEASHRRWGQFQTLLVAHLRTFPSDAQPVYLKTISDVVQGREDYQDYL